jgi:hypothetical protein
MVEVDISILFAGLSIAASILYYANVLMNANKTQRTQLFMRIYEQINSEESLKTWAELVNLQVADIDEFLAKYDSSVNPAHYAKRAHIWYTYNSTGELLRLGLIDSDLLARLRLDTQVIAMWEKWEPIIMETRERENVPDSWAGFEYLYREMRRLRESRGLPDMTLPYIDRSTDSP